MFALKIIAKYHWSGSLKWTSCGLFFVKKKEGFVEKSIVVTSYLLFQHNDLMNLT